MELGYDPVLHDMVLPAGLRPAFEIPPIVNSRGGRVYFDNCTHSSGRRRAFICCRAPGRGRCDKYYFLDKFAGQPHAAAYLFAWLSGAAEAEDHQHHLRFVPSLLQVAAHAAELADAEL